MLSGSPNPWATNSMASLADGSTFTFTANLVPGTAYAVYAWWTVGANRSTAVPYDIYSGGTPLGTVTVNQFINSGQWNPLGIYVFDGAATVTIRTVAPGGTISTCADAVWIVPVIVQSLEITGPATVNENSTAEYDAVAHCSGGLVVPVQPQTWTVDVPQATINSTGLLTAATVAADTPAIISAQFTINGTAFNDTHNITILNSGAVPVEVIVDNVDSGTSSTGSWFVSSTADPWGTNSLSTLTPGSTFTWTVNLVPGATYGVYAWWTWAANRYTAVPYQIYDGTTLLATVTVDQADEGGFWSLLGTYTFTSGTGSVTVSAAPTSAYSVGADAVRFVPAP